MNLLPAMKAKNAGGSPGNGWLILILDKKLISSAGILVQDKAEERSHSVCMASDDNAVFHQ